MKLDNIEWLFFDLGSTLVSEEKPFLHRLHEIADAVNEPFDAIQNKVLQLYIESVGHLGLTSIEYKADVETRKQEIIEFCKII